MLTARERETSTGRVVARTISISPRQLFISEKTVRNHLTAVFDKPRRELPCLRRSCLHAIAAWRSSAALNPPGRLSWLATRSN